MRYWTKHIINKLIYYDRLSDKYETSKFISLMLLFLLAMISVIFDGLFIGISLFVMLSIWMIFRTFVNQGEIIKSDYSIYDVPKVGDSIIFVKNKTFDSFSRPITRTSITSSAVYIKLKVEIKKGEEYRVTKTLWGIDDFVIEIVSVNDPTDDLETREYWKTKRDLREQKLNQILK
jgi:hypothetical protein